MVCDVLYVCPSGCTDEDASSAELAEKILYYYPPDTPIEAQISHISTCEGLVDFHR